MRMGEGHCHAVWQTGEEDIENTRRELDDRAGRDERELKMNWGLFVDPAPSSSPLTHLSSQRIGYSTRGPAVSVLLFSLRHSRNSQNMFPRFLTVPACQFFATDVGTSFPTLGSDSPYVGLHQVYLP